METNHPPVAEALFPKTIVRISLFLLVIAFIAVPLLSVSSASRQGSAVVGDVGGEASLPPATSPSSSVSVEQLSGFIPVLSSKPFMVPQAPVEAITITRGTGAAGSCATQSAPTTNFNLGQTICATLTGTPVSTRIIRRLAIVNPAGLIVAKANVTTNPQTLAFELPTEPISTFDQTVVDNRGTWRVNAINTQNASVKTSMQFVVRDPEIPVANLAITKDSPIEQVASGSIISFTILVTNYGPDAATNVVITDAVPANSSVGPITQAGETFDCASDSTPSTTICKIASLAKGDATKFKFTYQLNSGLSAGTIITNTASVASATLERSPKDNTSSAAVTVIAGEAPATCELRCPADVVVTADATQGGNAGAFVKFGAAAGFGECGAIKNTPVSGSFFTVAGSPHTVTSQSTLPGPDGTIGTMDDVTGESCTFTVKVVGTAAPTISCPTDRTATANNDGTATVNTGTPTFTASGGGTFHGVRSDSIAPVYDDEGTLVTAGFEIPLTDPYPTGVTGITWTVTDADGRKASCRQRIVVNAICATDTEAPTFAPTDDCASCGAPADITVSTGPDNTGCTVALDDELGQAIARDNCSVTISVSGIPVGNEFPIGSTTLTYRAIDPSGNSETDTQVVTVVDDTPPRIAAPPDASYVCPSQVPSGSASQATRGEVRDEDGNLLPPGPPFDNCSVPAVELTETNNDGAGSASSPLIITRTFTATDSKGNSASAIQKITVADGIAPTFTSVPANASYQCASQVPGASPSQAAATDNCASAVITVSDSSNDGAGSTASPLVITRTYTATDAAGNATDAAQTITVIDNTAPTIALVGANPQYVECHTSYPELGATASDNCTANFAATPSGTVDVDTPATYTITYNATDAAGNAATPVTRTVIVRDTIKPVITRNGPSSVTVECHTSYNDAGASASDACDTSVPVTTSGSVDVNTVGTYTLTYNAADDSGNAADAVTRTVVVVDTTPPVITVNSYAPSMWPPNHKYTTFQLTQFVTGASDSCNTPLNINDVVIEKVTSDELENSGGDGNTLDDIVIAANLKSVQLRSERDGGGNGRVYTITFKVTDGYNTTRVTRKVVVPHNQGATAIDSGVHYCEGTCP